MAKKKQINTDNVVIHDLTLVSPDRARKDIGTLKGAVENAELVHYPNRTNLYDIYYDVLTMDGHLSGIVEKRLNQTLNKRVLFKKSNGDYDDDLGALLNGSKGRQLRRLLLESIFWGISGVEFLIGPELNFVEIPRKHIKPEKGLITKSQYGLSEQDAFKYHDMPFVWVVGHARDLGRLLSCTMYALYKRGALGDYAQFVEIFGQPVRIIYYDAHDTATKAELKKTLNEAGSSLALMIPKQAEFQMMDGKTSNGDGKLQETFIKTVCNAEMSIAILGNTETTSASSSSGYAQSKEHAEQQDEIVAADLVLIEGLLNSEKFLKVLSSYGYAVEGGHFEHEMDVDLQQLKTRLEIDEKLAAIVPVEDDYFYETYRLPKPKNYDKLKAEMEARRSAVAKNTGKADPKDDDEQDDDQDDDKKKKLIDRAASGMLNKFFSGLADFFDQARQ